MALCILHFKNPVSVSIHLSLSVVVVSGLAAHFVVARTGFCMALPVSAASLLSLSVCFTSVSKRCIEGEHVGLQKRRVGCLDFSQSLQQDPGKLWVYSTWVLFSYSVCVVCVLWLQLLVGAV